MQHIAGSVFQLRRAGSWPVYWHAWRRRTDSGGERAGWLLPAVADCRCVAAGVRLDAGPSVLVNRWMRRQTIHWPNHLSSHYARCSMNRSPTLVPSPISAVRRPGEGFLPHFHSTCEHQRRIVLPEPERRRAWQIPATGCRTGHDGQDHTGYRQPDSAAVPMRDHHPGRDGVAVSASWRGSWP